MEIPDKDPESLAREAANILYNYNESSIIKTVREDVTPKINPIMFVEWPTDKQELDKLIDLLNLNSEGEQRYVAHGSDLR